MPHAVRMRVVTLEGTGTDNTKRLGWFIIQHLLMEWNQKSHGVITGRKHCN